jgi:Tfp pilus assembly protein PilN
MMATTLLPPSQAASRDATGELRFVVIRANLMPEEVLSARQVVVVRKQVVLGLVAVLVALIAWYGLSWWQTNSANSALEGTQRQGMALQSQQNQYTPLVQAQGQIANIRTQLEQLMVGDLQWKTMINSVRGAAPAGLVVQSITGNITPPTGTPTTNILNTSGAAAVGTLNVTGTAPDKRTVAAYADALGKVKGLTSPLISGIQASSRPITFTIAVPITADALGGRYSTPTVATGGN